MPYAANLPLALSVTNRLLSSYTGYAFNALRSSDSTTMDVAFSADGTVNTTAFLAWVGSASAYVTKIYNQGAGGTALDALQSTAADQPSIVTAGSLETGMSFNGISAYLEIPSASLSNYSNGTQIQVVSNAEVLGNGGFNGRLFDAGNIGFWNVYGGTLYSDVPVANRLSGAPPANWALGGYHIVSNEQTGSVVNLRIDGSVWLTGAGGAAISGTSNLRLGGLASGGGFWRGTLKTFCIWKDCTNAVARAAAIP